MTKIMVAVDKQGRITVDFNGFQGSTCYTEHEKLANLLAKLGIEQETESVQPKTEETNTEVKERAEVKG